MKRSFGWIVFVAAAASGSLWADAILQRKDGTKAVVYQAGTSVWYLRCPANLDPEKARTVCTEQVYQASRETYENRILSYFGIPAEYRTNQGLVRVSQSVERLSREITADEIERGMLPAANASLERLKKIQTDLLEAQKVIFDKLTAGSFKEYDEEFSPTFALFFYGFAQVWRHDPIGTVWLRWDSQHRSHEQATALCSGRWRLPDWGDFRSGEFMRAFLASEVGSGFGRMSVIWLQHTCALFWPYQGRAPSGASPMYLTETPAACTHPSYSISTICIRN